MFPGSDLDAPRGVSTGSLSKSGIRHFVLKSIQSSYPPKKGVSIESGRSNLTIPACHSRRFPQGVYSDKWFLVNSSSLQGPSLRIQK